MARKTIRPQARLVHMTIAEKPALASLSDDESESLAQMAVLSGVAIGGATSSISSIGTSITIAINTAGNSNTPVSQFLAGLSNTVFSNLVQGVSA